MNIEVEIERPRTESIRDFIYYFVLKSVISAGTIEKTLEQFRVFLIKTLVNEQVVKNLRLKYYREGTDGSVTQVGEVSVVIDWVINRVEISSGNETILISKADPLGSISPAMSRLANHLREMCIRWSVNSFSWSVIWIEDVYKNRERAEKLNLENNLVPVDTLPKKFIEAHDSFDRDAKPLCEAKIEKMQEVLWNIRWRPLDQFGANQ